MTQVASSDTERVNGDDVLYSTVEYKFAYCIKLDRFHSRCCGKLHRIIIIIVT